MTEIIDKKLIQRRRIMKYYIEATYKIMEEEGIDMVTIRKISDIAGYNSATLYNYFENLDHLIAFASLKYLKSYADNLIHYTKKAKNSYDKYLLIWECFCYYSFQNPILYHKIFFEEFGNNLNVALREYYAIFPDELAPDYDIDLKNMLLQYNIYDRTAQSLEKCVRDKYFNQSDIHKISELSLLIYEGMLDRIISKMWKGSLEDATKRTISHISNSIQFYKL
jgi:AcrR family transcriptional regulator